MMELNKIIEKLKWIKSTLISMMDIYTQTDELKNSTIKRISWINAIIENANDDIEFVKNKIVEYFNLDINTSGWYHEIIKYSSTYDFIMEKQ